MKELKHIRNIWIITYYINEKVNDKLNYTIDYCDQIDFVPRMYEKAIKSGLTVKWKGAMKEELNILKENETFESALLPPNTRTVGICC